MNDVSLGNLFKSIIVFNKYKTIVEVGVAMAGNTRFLCEAAKETGGFVYGYDLWDRHGLWSQFDSFSTKERCDEYLSGLGFNNFKLFKTNTKTEEFKKLIAHHNQIDFAFIDGCHSYEGIKNDFEVVYPSISEYGMIVFHDTLRIDGCREFMIDLRTELNDGTFDLLLFPFGNNERRVGVTILMKRSCAAKGIQIDEICGSPSKPEEIYNKENRWHESQKQSNLA